MPKSSPFDVPAGSLRLSAQIQTASIQRDPYGQQTATWSTIATVRCSLECVEGVATAEKTTGETLSSRNMWNATLRWPGSSVTIAPGQRFVVGDQTYLIQTVDNVLFRNRFIRCNLLQIDGGSN